MLVVWAVDPSRVRRGTFGKAVAACTAVVRDADVGTFQVDVHSSHPLAPQVGPGWRLMIVDDGETIITGPVAEITEDVQGRVRTLTGVSDMQHIQDRLLYADPSKVYTQQQAEGKFVRSGPAETVIRDSVWLNVGNGAVEARRQDGWVMPVSAGRGVSVKLNDADKPLLETLRPLARAGGITFDVKQANNNNLVFEFYVPVDRSRTVRFTERNGGLKEGTYTLAAPEVNVVEAAGQGLGTYLNRREYVRATSWGRRVEQFEDQTSTDDDPEIAQAAKEILDEGREGATASFSAQEVPGLRYGTDFRLGDTVTVEFGSATVSEPVRAIELTWDGFGRTASLTLGDHDSADDKTPKWVKKIKKLDARVRSIETR